MNKLLSGLDASNAIVESVTEAIKVTKDDFGVPTLDVILVGNNPASESYVKNKKKMFEQAGAICNIKRLPESVDKQTLLDTIAESNNTANGVILQLPAPYAEEAISTIDINKDVDGFISGSSFIPCTPLGVLELLKHYNIETEGKDIVIIGRSVEVGQPLARLLSSKTYNATVTLCHSKTKNLAEHTKRADIIISAIGKPEYITADMIKENAVCIDVGINRVPDASKKSGSRLCGDFLVNDALIAKCGGYTPTPGGTGPMTVAALLMQTYKAFKNQNNLS